MAATSCETANSSSSSVETCGSPWVESRPIDRTLGPGRELPFPSVTEVAAYSKNGFPPYPVYMGLEVTNLCNLRCTHCNYRWGLDHYTRPRGFVLQEVVDRALEEAYAHKVPMMMNYDGEPLLNKNFINYLEQASLKGVNTYFNTNGTFFDQAFTDRLVTFYKGSIFWSLDGDRDWFEKVRLRGDYDRVLANLDYFLAANEKAGSPITVGVSLCNLGQTTEERKAFLDAWLPRVNYVSMGEVNDKGGKMISEPMTLMKVKKRPTCIVPWQTLGICHNGDVIPCSIYITRANTVDAILGNILEQSIEEIWRGEKFEEFRAMLTNNRYSNSFCHTCERWLSQFGFPAVVEDNIEITRNGYWTQYRNLEKGDLNFTKKSK